jgi:hypothetical protein
MADAGAQQILDLLAEKSVRLTKAGDRLQGALKRVAKQEDGVPAPIAFAALDDVRSFYAQLGGEIASIETASPAKADVLAALELLDLGHAGFEDSLHEGIDEESVKLARSARRLLKQAGKDLETAREGLT